MTIGMSNCYEKYESVTTLASLVLDGVILKQQIKIIPHTGM